MPPRRVLLRLVLAAGCAGGCEAAADAPGAPPPPPQAGAPPPAGGHEAAPAGAASGTAAAAATAGGAEANPAAAALDWEGRVEPRPHDTPAGAPDVVLHAPAGRSARPWWVVFLHGWRGCARALVAAGPVACAEGEAPEAGWGLGAAHDAAGTDSVLVVPQLAWRARDGSPGRFAREGVGAGFLEAVARASPTRAARLEDVPGLVLVAHSAGFEAAHALLAHGALGPRVRAVVLMDALYARAEAFGDWVAAAPERRLLAWYASDQAPYRNGRRLLDALRRRLGPDAVLRHRRGPLGDALARHRYVLAFAPDRHAEVPERRLAESLRALAAAPGGLPLRPAELRPAEDGPTSPRPRRGARRAPPAPSPPRAAAPAPRRP